MKWFKWIATAIFALAAISFVALLVMSNFAEGKVRGEVSVTIAKPAAAVFPWLVTPEKLAQWLEGFQESIPLNGDSLRVGARSKEIIVSRDERFEMEMEITELELNRLLSYHISHETFEQDGRYFLAEANGQTTVRFTSVSQFKPFLFRLLSPLIALSAQARQEDNFAMLKKLLENFSTGHF